uniref:Reverse transcriptase domain-containing protein n=1 Tax=Tanacetum cinerariifolium TaxID=118510 RepID=A0A6L2NA65_TANCI|nr:hypothetical protein [Tanacetum cinerariifolium]
MTKSEQNWTKSRANGKRGKTRQSQSPVTVKKATKRRKYKLNGPKLKFKEDLFASGVKHGIIQDSSDPSNDNSNVDNAPREPFVVNQDPGKDSSQSPPQINHHCFYGCGDPLEGIFYHQCPCKLFGNGAYYGYNCPSKVSIIPDPESFTNQTIKELPPTVQNVDPKSDLVHKSPNVFNPPPQLPFISCKFCRNDACYGHYCTHQQYTVNHPVFTVQNELFDSQNKLMEQLTSMCDMVSQLIQKKEEEKKIREAQAANAQYWKILAYYDDDDDYNFAITPTKPVNSLNMRDEHPDIISAMELDEFIKSSVENLVSIPTESEGESECDVPIREEFITFSNILFDAEYEFDSSDDQSSSDEDVPEKIFSNPLFEEDITPMKIDQLHYNVESDLIESLHIHDSSILISSKIDSLLDEFFEFVSENSDAEIKSFSPSHILVEDSDSLMEEVDLSFTPDYPMPPGIEDDDYDSERDILILKDLLSNDTPSFLEIESFHFDISSFSRPPAKPLDGNTGILNVKMMGDISDQKLLSLWLLLLGPEAVPDCITLSNRGASDVVVAPRGALGLKGAPRGALGSSESPARKSTKGSVWWCRKAPKGAFGGAEKHQRMRLVVQERIEGVFGCTEMH